MTQALTPTAGDVKLATTTTTTTNEGAPRVSKAAFWTGWVLTAIPILWIGVFGIVLSLTQRAMVEENMAKYGYPASTVIPIHIVAVACVILYAVPRTAMLGAILLTGYLGGATATHVQAAEPWFFPVVFGVIVWLGLYLRDPRVRALVPLRRLGQ